MTWMLSGATRQMVRQRYRRAIVRSCLTHDLAERATLQASAHRLYAALHASGFEGAAIVLLCQGDASYTYDDGDAAPLHCTVCFLGNAADMTPEARDGVVSATRDAAGTLDPFDAQVTAKSQFGSTPVRLVEHEDINTARAIVLADPFVDAYAATYEDHPHYIPHVSGLGNEQVVRFDRIAAMLGGEDHVFPLGYTPAEPGYQPPADLQTPDLELDTDKRNQSQGALT